MDFLKLKECLLICPNALYLSIYYVVVFNMLQPMLFES